jgi:hypothetical protein
LDRGGWLRALGRKLLSLYDRLFSDPCLFDPDELYRGVHPHWVKPNGEISSGAFDGDEMSVDIAKKTTAQRSWARIRKMHAGIASITVGLARSLKQEVRHHPVPLNYAHGLVIGKKTSSVRKQFARSAKWVIRPKIDGRTS